MDSYQLGSTKKINLISKTENLTHLEGKKGQIILFSLRGFQPPFCFTSASSSRIMLRTRGCFDTTRVVQIWMTWRKVKSRSLASFQRSRLECIYLLIFKCTELFTRKASKAWSVDRIQIITEESAEECSHSCLFFSAGLLKLDFNDTLVSSTHTFPVNIFNLEGGETMLAQDKENFHAPAEDRTRNPPVQWLERPIFIVFGGSRVRFSPGRVRKFSLSRASMVFPLFLSCKCSV